MFVNSLPEQYFCRIRRFAVLLILNDRPKARGWRKWHLEESGKRTCLSCDIDLNKSKLEKQLVITLTGGQYEVEFRGGSLMHEMLEIMRGIRNRRDGRVRVVDFFTMRRILETAVFDGMKPLIMWRGGDVI